jgi:hypothetical protein
MNITANNIALLTSRERRALNCPSELPVAEIDCGAAMDRIVMHRRAISETPVYDQHGAFMLGMMALWSNREIAIVSRVGAEIIAHQAARH